jgi:hypothetical protein
MSDIHRTNSYKPIYVILINLNQDLLQHLYTFLALNAVSPCTRQVIVYAYKGLSANLRFPLEIV